MTTDYKGALNEIFFLINSAWKLNTGSIVGYVPEIKWPGSSNDTIPDASKFWARVSNKSVLCGQKTLSESVVVSGARRFENNGLVFFQLFAPKDVDSELKSINLSNMLLNTFRKGTPNVIIRNARIDELPNENGCVRRNIICEYEYDEISNVSVSTEYPQIVEPVGNYVDGGTFN